MRPLRRAVLGACLALALVAPAPALAATCTVGEPACPDLQAALDRAAAAPDADVIRIAGDVAARAGGFAYGGSGPLELLGAGPELATVPGPLRLAGAEVAVRALTLSLPTQAGRAALEANGVATRLRVTGRAPRPGQAAVRALPGSPLLLEDAAIDATGLAAGLDAGCGAELRARHVTLAGSAPVGARAACAAPAGAARLSLRSSIVADGYPVALVHGARDVTSAAYSSLAGTALGTVIDAVTGDPGLRSATDLRLTQGSPLVERGDPAPLEIDGDGAAVDRSEPMQDLAGAVRVADADGDGRARRDVGAHELPAPSLPVPDANVLVNPDAEGAGPGAPPGWRVTGGFTAVDYGTPPFPSLEAGAASAGGARFFAGGAEGDATATQVVDLSSRAAQVDSGIDRASLSGLLGGFRADGDLPRAQAVFRDAAGVALAQLELGPVDADARGNATQLLPRSVSGTVPRFARSVEVVLRATKAAGGSYTDAYFDNFGLAFLLPELPSGVDPGRPGLRPFAGMVVLSGTAAYVRSTGRAKVVVGCASATVARCTGELTVAAILARGAPRVTIARAAVRLAPGGTRRVSLRFSAVARRYLRRHSRLRVRLALRTVDGQGLRRARTVPLIVRPARAARRRAASRPPRARGRTGTARGPAPPPAGRR